MEDWIPEKLKAIAYDLKRGEPSPVYTPREILEWFGSQRRGWRVIFTIREALKELGLGTDPNFAYAYFDGVIQFKLVEEEPTKAAASGEQPSNGDPPTAVVAELVGTAIGDPTYRIGKLRSANEQPTSVNPNASIEEAVTLMLLHDFSQLPVMQGERSVKGAITWQSLGSSLWLGKCCRSVQDCMAEPAVISSEASLFAVIPTIVEKGYVLIQDQQTKVISGIVTTTDLSLQFRQLAEPFLRLGEIENHLRRLSDGKFSQDLLASAKDPIDVDRPVTDLKDLSLGEHIRLLENPDRWDALGLKIDRTTFVNHLNQVKEIRNAVMHFDPDPTPGSELDELRQFVRLLEAVGIANPQDDARRLEFGSGAKRVNSTSATGDRSSRAQRKLLYSPVQNLRNKELIIRRTRDLVNPTELPGLLAALPKHAQHFAV